MAAQPHIYLVGLGSNMRHVRHGGPRAVLAAALGAMAAQGVEVQSVSPIITSDPVGPSLRRYANAAAIVRTNRAPADFLRLLKELERAFGRRLRGQRWRARTLDCDIVLWNGGRFRSPELTIPHRLFRVRPFVLGPAAAIAPAWRDPVTGFTLRQLHARLTGHRPTPRWPHTPDVSGPLAQ